MKKVISLMLVLLLIVGCFAGCGGGEEAAEGEGSKIIGVCMQNKSSSISVLQEEALIEMFEPLGYDVQVVSADDSSATQRSQVENFILLNAEMLVILPCEISTLEDSLVKAREAGIKVVVSGGTGTVSEDAYDAVCSDDEFMVGMYVASVAKTWIEENMDPNGDWEVHFLSSTLSEDAITRCQGEAMILEQYLKNKNGEYVNLMGEVVDEANKVENPVYCEMVAKTLAADPDVIIFDEPTKGIDVGAKQEIYNLMNELVAQGKAIIMVSSDMEEILGMSDRIIVLHEGLVSGELRREEFSQERVLHLASGL